MLDSCSLDAKSNVLLSESSGTPVDWRQRVVCCGISLEAIITLISAIHGITTIPLHKILVNEMVEDLETPHDVIDLHK